MTRNWVCSEFTRAILAFSAAIAFSISAGAQDNRSVIICDSSVPISAVGATTTQLIALSAGKTIYVCGFVMAGSVAGTAKFVYGTGTNCATGTTNLTGAMNLAANGVISSPGMPGYQFKTAGANALCLTGTGTSQSLNGYVTYAQF